MKITGELLKAERMKQGLSVADVANSLKLSSRIITSIETGDVDELPAKTFIRGFVKSYAQFLKLDADLILRQFLEEMGSTQPLPKTPPPQALTPENKPQKTKSDSEPRVPTNLDLNQDNKKKTLIYSAVASALLIVILVVNNIVDKYQKESVVDANNIQQVQPLAPTDSASTTSDGQAAAPATSAEATTTEASTANPTAAAPGTPESNPQVVNVDKPAGVSELNVVTTPPSDFEPSVGKPVELIVVAKKETEFFYAKGNTKSFTRVKLAPKEVQIIRSSAGLHLKSEDGGALNLILNGIEKGQPSAANKPVRLTF